MKIKKSERMHKSRAGREWFESINIGDRVYLFAIVNLNCLHSPIGKIRATVAKKEARQEERDTEYIIFCNIDEEDVRFCDCAMNGESPVAFRCDEYMYDVQGNYMVVLDADIASYRMFTSEEECDRCIRREKAYIKLRSFLNGKECLVDCGKDSPGEIRTFHLSDYTFEDMQAVVNALRISEMPEKLARFYNWEEYV